MANRIMLRAHADENAVQLCTVSARMKSPQRFFVTYRHYTASEIAAANDTDLPDLLASLGYQVRRVGRYYTTSEMDSLRIWGRRTWYRYSESTGGDAIAFVRHFHGLSFPEAVR